MDTDLQQLVSRPLLFTIFTLLNIMFSWMPLRKSRGHHGFYRFFVFEGVIALSLINGAMGPTLSPFFLQNISQLLKIISIVFVAAGFIRLRRFGGYAARSNFPENKAFENTSVLVTTGIYRYIRHPMYGALLLIAWGVYLGYPTLPGTPIVVIVSIAMVMTAKVEEQENVAYFGSEYVEYMKRTKRFLPFIM